MGFYLFLKIDFRIYKKLNYFVYIVLIALPILFIIISVFNTPLYKEHGKGEDKFNSLMPLVKGKCIMFTPVYYTPYSKAYYSYSAIFYNPSTPSGWSPEQASTKLNERLSEIGQAFRLRDTEEFLRIFNEPELNSITSYEDHCDYLSDLDDFILIKETEDTCLHEIKPNN